MRTAFILGGTGQIGFATAAKLLSNGWRVTLGSRGRRAVPGHLQERGLTAIELDRSVSGGLQTAIKDGCDLLIDTIAFNATHARQLLRVQDGIGQIIAISSASVYRDECGRTLDEAKQGGFPDLPESMTEEQPTVEPGSATYSMRKVAMERVLLDGRAAAAIIRPCAIHGPYSAHPREWWFIKRLRDGRDTIPLSYRGLSQFQTSAAADVAELISALAEARASGIYNVAGSDSPTVMEIGQAIFSACGIDARLLPIDTPAYSTRVGATPWSVPKPFTIAVGKARSIGYKPVGDYRATVAETCAWLMDQPVADWQLRFPQLAAYPFELFDYEAEDRFLRGSKYTRMGRR